MVVADDEYVEAMRRGVKLAHARGVTAVHDKDGWLGALRLWQRLNEHGGLTLRVWQSLPHEEVDTLRTLGVRSGFGDSMLRVGYLKVFMTMHLSVFDSTSKMFRWVSAGHGS